MIGIIDYGVGNIGSVAHAFMRLGIPSRLLHDAKDFTDIDKFVIPGVGHAGAGMKNLTDRGLIAPIKAAIEKGLPLLGICLGMQLLAEHSAEGEIKCLGIIPADVVLFDNSKAEDALFARVPHMGWNTLEKKKDSPLLSGLSPQDEFYFAHSYFLLPRESDMILATTSYNSNFPSVVSRGNVYGVQFHPEKSREAGALILKNFSSL